MKTSQATAQAAKPMTAPDHCMSSNMLDVGGGIALRNFFSSISNPAMGPQSYATRRPHAN